MIRCGTSLTSRSPRRGLALAAVLVVGLGLLLIAVGTLHLVRAEVSAIAAGEARVQSRFAARAAARALMTELAGQREAVLAGLPLDAPEALELFDLEGGDGGRLAIARLLPVGTSGSRLVPEAGRLDLNVVDAEALIATGLFDRREAEAAIAARDARPSGRFASVLDLLALEGDAAIGPDRVLGSLEDLRILSRVDAMEEDLGERVAARLDADLGPSEEGLIDVLTVHAFEPDVRRDGSPRATANDASPDLTSLDDATGRLVLAALGAATSGENPDRASRGGGRRRSGSRATAESNESPAPPESTAETTPDALGPRIAALAAGIPDADVGLAYDAITRFDGGWRNGLLDINTAPASALRGINGIDPELAASIVARRDVIDDARRFDRFWPVAEGLVELSIWGGIVDRITTRSTVWRAVIAVGVVPADDVDAPLESPIVWEMVVDLGESRPRLVEVRDVTMLELVARIEAARLGDGSAIERGIGEFDGGIEDASSEGLFDESPLFDDEPLFEDAPLFEDDPLFGDSPLFDDAPLFDAGSPFDDPPADRTGSSPRPAGAAGPRDRGPGGRWRPATSSR
ncbi:MAG: hypothetical protein RLZZ461_1741 [Planctomycetota bacterium]